MICNGSLSAANGVAGTCFILWTRLHEWNLCLVWSIFSLGEKGAVTGIG